MKANYGLAMVYRQGFAAPARGEAHDFSLHLRAELEDSFLRVLSVFAG